MIYNALQLPIKPESLNSRARKGLDLLCSRRYKTHVPRQLQMMGHGRLAATPFDDFEDIFSRRVAENGILDEVADLEKLDNTQ